MAAPLTFGSAEATSPAVSVAESAMINMECTANNTKTSHQKLPADNDMAMPTKEVDNMTKTIQKRRPSFNATSLPRIDAGTEKILTMAAAVAADMGVMVPAGSMAVLNAKKATTQAREPKSSVQ